MFSNIMIVEELKNLLWLVVSVAIAFVFIKLSYFLVRKHFEGKKDKAQVKELISIYQYSLAIIVILVLVIIFSNVFKNVLASIGLLAAGLAIALQRPILNIFGWIIIVLKKPYVIGDRVSIGSNKGDVFDINIMHTSMGELQDDAPSGRMIAVPNEFVLTQPITNFTKGTPYVWDTLSIVIEKDSNEAEAKKFLQKATDSVVGPLMAGLSSKWSASDGRKVNVEPEINTEIILVNGISAIQLTSRYLCDVHEKKSIRTRINNALLVHLKNSGSVRLK